MKATILKSVMCVMIVLAGAMSANVYAGNKYVTNDEMKDGQVCSKTIYLQKEGLTRHMKYNYTYNENGIMTDKEAFKWNESDYAWTPYYKISFSYLDNNVMMEFARWNPKANAYNLSKERTVYEIDSAYQPVSYTSLKWDNASESWAFINKNDIENTTLLYAISE